MFPYDEFRGLLFEVIERMELHEELRESGLVLLGGVYHRIAELEDLVLLERIQGLLKVVMKPPEKKQTLTSLVQWIANTTNPGSVYVLKRTDKLGSTRELQETAIREYFSEQPPTHVWFAPERFGQKVPAMAFVCFREKEGMEINQGDCMHQGQQFSIAIFNYDR